MRRHRRKTIPGVIAALTTLLVCSGTNAYTQATVPVGRYSVTTTIPAFSQQYPLAQVVSVGFSRNTIHTVGDAARVLMRGSGYALIQGADPYAIALMQKPLPDVHRELGPVPLAIALKILVGAPYEILVNDVRREVCVALGTGVSADQRLPVSTVLGTDRQSIPHETAVSVTSPPMLFQTPFSTDVSPTVHRFTGKSGYVRKY